MTTINLPSIAPATSWPATPAPGTLIRSLAGGFFDAIARVAARTGATHDALPPGSETVDAIRNRHAELYMQAERVMSIL